VRFAAHVAARLARRPVSQILGRRAFWGRDFEVTTDVLDPRPETETLVALALRGAPPTRLLDLGTGSGALLTTLLCEWPQARGLGTDLSDAALAVAARNAARHGVAGRAALRRADWTQGIEGAFDLVVSNPPYIPEAEVAALAPEVRDWEPHQALTPGPRGLESFERIARGLAGLLAPQGRALLEFGAGQGEAVAGVFREAGFRQVALRPDLDGRKRVVEVSDPGPG
jgi:release factor glutamine methyltransferase